VGEIRKNTAPTCLLPVFEILLQEKWKKSFWRPQGRKAAVKLASGVGKALGCVMLV